uniref:Uncharacterized protein n=1 Tax=Steinernema glaseri TaxID=37863 RepID=A0A1I7YJ15_9BILA
MFSYKSFKVAFHRRAALKGNTSAPVTTRIGSAIVVARRTTARAERTIAPSKHHGWTEKLNFCTPRKQRWTNQAIEDLQVSSPES